jgi:hypothetical protein
MVELPHTDNKPLRLAAPKLCVQSVVQTGEIQLPLCCRVIASSAPMVRSLVLVGE